MLSVTEYLAENPAGRGTLYYPGALADLDPFQIFRSRLNRCIYADYAIEVDDVESLLGRLRANGSTEMTPADFQREN